MGALGLTGPQGAAGATGPTGPAGAAGAVGAVGAVGAQGPIGLTGLQGAAGAAGPTGPAGAAGAVGAQGPIGADGAAGAPGATGAQGPAGATGAPGPAGSNGLAEYAYVYNLTAETVAIEAAIAFDSNGVMTSGITHSLGTSDITLLNAGIYKIDFSVSGTEPNQMALFVNGVVVPGTTYGSGAGTQQNSGQAIIAVGAGGVLSVRNHSSAAAVGLAALIGGTQPTANASVTIEKLA